MKNPDRIRRKSAKPDARPKEKLRVKSGGWKRLDVKIQFAQEYLDRMKLRAERLGWSWNTCVANALRCLHCEMEGERRREVLNERKAALERAITGQAEGEAYEYGKRVAEFPDAKKQLVETVLDYLKYGQAASWARLRDHCGNQLS